LEEVTRYLNLEKLLPCYRCTVTTACLKAIRKLQKAGHLPPNPGLFRDYAKYGQFKDTRLAAMECLVDYIKVEGKFDDLEHLIEIVKTDPMPSIRHELVRLLIKNPPFERGRHHRNDRKELVQEMWSMMNSHFWYDSRMRCDIVDLYQVLYGRRRPPSLPIPELAALGQPTKAPMGPPRVKDNQKKSFVIPKAEKREREREPELGRDFGGPSRDFSSTVIKTEPSLGDAPGDLPDYFMADSPDGDSNPGFDEWGEQKKRKKKEKKKKKHKEKHRRKDAKPEARWKEGEGFPKIPFDPSISSKDGFSSGGSSSGSNPGSPTGNSGLDMRF